MLYSLNQFIRIIFSQGKVILVNSESDREYISDFKFISVMSKLAREKRFSSLKFEEIYLITYGSQGIIEGVLGKLIENEIIVGEDSKIDILFKKYKPWFENGWGDTLHYLLSTKDYPFIQYEEALGFIQDNNMMKEYLGVDDFYPYKRDIPSIGSKKFSSEFHWPKENFSNFFHQKKYSKTHNLSNYSEFEKIGIVMRLAFGVLEENTFGHGNFPKKVPPSGGSRHPSSGYLCDITGNIGEKGISYLYQQYLHSLVPVSKMREMEDAINEGCYNFLNHSKFQAKYCIFITSDFVKSMWRYRESRSYRVLYNDCGHIVKILNYGLKMMNYSFQEFSFIDEEKIGQILHLEQSEEKCEHPIYGIFIG